MCFHGNPCESLSFKNHVHVFPTQCKQSFPEQKEGKVRKKSLLNDTMCQVPSNSFNPHIPMRYTLLGLHFPRGVK